MLPTSTLTSPSGPPDGISPHRKPRKSVFDFFTRSMDEDDSDASKGDVEPQYARAPSKWDMAAAKRGVLSSLFKKKTPQISASKQFTIVHHRDIPDVPVEATPSHRPSQCDIVIPLSSSHRDSHSAPPDADSPGPTDDSNHNDDVDEAAAVTDSLDASMSMGSRRESELELDMRRRSDTAPATATLSSPLTSRESYLKSHRKPYEIATSPHSSRGETPFEFPPRNSSSVSVIKRSSSSSGDASVVVEVAQPDDRSKLLKQRRNNRRTTDVKRESSLQRAANKGKPALSRESTVDEPIPEEPRLEQHTNADADRIKFESESKDTQRESNSWPSTPVLPQRASRSRDLIAKAAAPAETAAGSPSGAALNVSGARSLQRQPSQEQHVQHLQTGEDPMLLTTSRATRTISSNMSDQGRRNARRINTRTELLLDANDPSHVVMQSTI